MRLNPWIYGTSLIIGIIGVVFAARAYISYLDVARTFTDVELRYVSDSFTWHDPEFRSGSAMFRLVNDSEHTATVEYFGISLRYGPLFAGSDYRQWQPITVPPGESRDIPVEFTVTTHSIREEGGTANLRFDGQMRTTFARFEEPLVFRFQGEIGPTPYE